MARLLFRTLESMTTPCSLKTRTLFEYLMPEDVTVCDIPLISSRSSGYSGVTSRFLIIATAPFSLLRKPRPGSRETSSSPRILSLNVGPSSPRAATSHCHTWDRLGRLPAEPACFRFAGPRQSSASAWSRRSVQLSSLWLISPLLKCLLDQGGNQQLFRRVLVDRALLMLVYYQVFPTIQRITF